MVYDIVILGGGVVGCSVLNKLTRLNKKCILLEKGSDVAVGTSKANSGIVHAGFDAKPGSLKATLNVRGAELYPKLCKELGIHLINNGALVIGSDIKVVKDLYARGIKNKVKGLEILDRKKLIKKLPHITDKITCGLFAKTSAIVSPYKFTIALAEESVLNGGEIKFNFDTKKFTKKDDYYILSNGKENVMAKKIVVAVGASHNELSKILGTTSYDIKYRRGEYYLLDRDSIDVGGYTVFPLPNKDSKGVLVTPTISNNIIVGPTSILTDSDSTMTTIEGLDIIASNATTMLSNVNLKKNIRVFSGVRTLVGDDFVIEKDTKNSDIINITGICSPGLSAAPAIAEYVANILDISGVEKKMIRRSADVSIKGLPPKKLNALIKKDSNYGKIVCRCETVSEAEIINAINSPLKPMSVDGIKRRVRAGMGRCQGGFCFMRVMELIARERKIPLEDVVKENSNSNIIIGDIK